ncbi:glycosyltransferase family 4 protein [Pseudotenacibaculum sp. MALMAid0570]|uniref:glycosyltransferase family 4 protein n=1 Tax=Pseudotenacibaculum sp. MALMAid0570 TaxID=3143938 RepID=UPI0032DF0E35
MNVLFVIKGNEPYVSQQAQIELAAGLQKQGVKILLTGNFSKEVEHHLKDLNIQYKKVFPLKSIDKKYTKDFQKLVTDHNINLVHFVDGKSCRNAIPVLRKTNIKSVIYFGSASLHWYDLSSYLTYLNSNLDAIICNSQFVYNHVRNQLFGKNKQKAIKIYKGYNPDWFQKSTSKDLSEFGIPKDAIVVSLVGNHRKVKGTKYFLRSSYHLETDKNVHYILIGEKTQQASFQKLRNQSPIKDQIHLLGRREDVISILKSTHIYAQTSLEEGFGRAISEAMSVGKPIVMTDAGGCTELIDESSGIIVPKKNSKAIANAISKLINNDDLRQKMGENAKHRIETVYHINDTVNDTLKLYQRLLNS